MYKVIHYSTSVKVWKQVIILGAWLIELWNIHTMEYD